MGKPLGSIPVRSKGSPSPSSGSGQLCSGREGAVAGLPTILLEHPVGMNQPSLVEIAVLPLHDPPNLGQGALVEPRPSISRYIVGQVEGGSGEAILHGVFESGQGSVMA